MDEIGGFMSGDHDVIDALLQRFRAAGGAALEEFASALARHIDWEERILFPSFALKAGAGTAASIDAMHDQHEEFMRQIEDIRRCPPDDAILRRNLLDVLVESLADHNHAEEDYIYPWIDGALDDAERASVLAALKADQGGHSHGTQNVA